MNTTTAQNFDLFGNIIQSKPVKVLKQKSRVIDDSKIDLGITVVPYLSIHPDRINFYNEVIFENGRRGRCKLKTENLRNNNNKNKISKSAETKIKRAITYISHITTPKSHYLKDSKKSIKFKLTFVTLTLPSRQIHSDQQIRRDCFHHFLTVAMRKWNVKTYVMRSERQANGNLHFHFVTDVFIPHQELRDTWNNIINKLGYVNEYRKSMLEFHKEGFRVRNDLIKYWPLKAQKKAYESGVANDWYCPNTTDIHSLRFVSNISAYICKYISKQNHINHAKVRRINSPIKNSIKPVKSSISKAIFEFLESNIDTGRLWSCSYNLSNLHGGRDIVDSEISQELQILRSSKQSRYFEKDYCRILFYDFKDLERLGCFKLAKLLRDFLILKFDLPPEFTFLS